MKKTEELLLVPETVSVYDVQLEEAVLTAGTGEPDDRKAFYISRCFIGAEDNDENRRLLRDLLTELAQERERALLFIFVSDGLRLAAEDFFPAWARKAELLGHDIMLEEEAAAAAGLGEIEGTRQVSRRVIAQSLIRLATVSLC